MSKSESQRFAEFIEWIWKQRDVDKSYHVQVVTSEGSKSADLPQPPLSLNESKGLFRFLASKNLATLVDKDDGLKGLLYSLNIVEHYKWSEVIRELKKPDWQRSWLYMKIRNSFFWIVTLILAAFLGATGEPIFNIAAHKFHWIEEPAAPVVSHEADVLKKDDKPKNDDDTPDE